MSTNNPIGESAGRDGTFGDNQSFFADKKWIAAFFGGNKPLSTATIYRLVADGKIPKPVNVGGSARWVRSECEAARAKMLIERGRARPPIVSRRHRKPAGGRS